MNIIPSGSGPNKAQRENHWFNIKLFAKSENKSIAEGYRENSNLIDSSLNVDTLYICPELFVGENNEKLIRKFENKNIRIVKVASKVFKEISYRDKPDGIISIFDVNKNKLPKTISGPILIPDQIEKPGNLGTMIRTSKSFGINNCLRVTFGNKNEKQIFIKRRYRCS